MPLKVRQRGIIPLAVLGVGFLIVSLVAVTAATNNPLKNYAIQSWAKGEAKVKTWRDRGSPAARHAGKVAETQNTIENYKAQKAALAQLKGATNLSAADKATLDNLQKVIDGQALLNKDQVDKLNSIIDKGNAAAAAAAGAGQPSNNGVSGGQSGPNGSSQQGSGPVTGGAPTAPFTPAAPAAPASQAPQTTTTQTIVSLERTDEGFITTTDTITRDASNKVIATKSVSTMSKTESDFTQTPDGLVRYDKTVVTDVGTGKIVDTKTSKTLVQTTAEQNTAKKAKEDLVLKSNPDAQAALNRFEQNNGNITYTPAELNAIAKFCAEAGESCTNVRSFSLNYLNMNPVTATNPQTGQQVQIPPPNLNPSNPLANQPTTTVSTPTGKSPYDPPAFSLLDMSTWNRVITPNGKAYNGVMCTNGAGGCASGYCGGDGRCADSGLFTPVSANKEAPVVTSSHYDPPKFDLFNIITWNRVTTPGGKAYNGVTCSGSGDSCVSGYCGGDHKCADNPTSLSTPGSVDKAVPVTNYKSPFDPPTFDPSNPLTFNPKTLPNGKYYNGITCAGSNDVCGSGYCTGGAGVCADKPATTPTGTTAGFSPASGPASQAPGAPAAAPAQPAAPNAPAPSGSTFTPLLQTNSSIAQSIIPNSPSLTWVKAGCGPLTIANILNETSGANTTGDAIANTIPADAWAGDGISSPYIADYLRAKGYTADPFNKSVQYHLGLNQYGTTALMAPNDLLLIGANFNTGPNVTTNKDKFIPHIAYFDGYKIVDGKTIYNLVDSYDQWGSGFGCEASGDASFKCSNDKGQQISINTDNADLYIVSK